MSEPITAPVEPIIEPVAPIVEPQNNSVSYESHRKLLSEKKAIQKEAEELRVWRKEQELNKMQESGQKDEVIEALRKEIADRDEKFKSTTEKVAFDKFESQCVAMARDLNCDDTETLMMYMNKERMASIEIDDRLNANKDDLKRVIEEIKGLKPKLFEANSVNHNPITGVGFKKPEQKSVGDMSKDDIVTALRNL